MRVLIVEDEVRLAENIAAALREGPGYAVDVTHEGKEAVFLCQSGNYDLILLDLMIPGLDGRGVLRRLRAEEDRTPVLVLTAMAGSPIAIELLNAGADDFMAKPFDLGELIARVRALIRRGKGASHAVLTFGQLTLDTAEQTVLSADAPVDLSPTEYRVLEYLMHRPRVLVSKRELLEHLYDFTWEHHSNVIEVHVSNLRRKLRLMPGSTALENVRGRGYRLNAGAAAESGELAVPEIA